MRRVFLFAALAIFAFGCKGSKEHNEAYAQAVSRLKALGIATTEAEAIAQYNGGSTSRYYDFSPQAAQLLRKIAEYQVGGDRSRMAGLLKELGTDAGQIEKAATEGSIPATIATPYGIAPDFVVKMNATASFFGARAIYRAEGGDLDSAIADVFQIVSVDKQLSKASDTSAVLTSTVLAQLATLTAGKVAAFCANDRIQLGSLQKAVAELAPPNYRQAIGFMFIQQAKLCDDVKAENYDLAQLGITDTKSISSVDIDLAKANAARITADIAEVFPDRDKIAAVDIPQPSGAANALTRVLVHDLSSLADGQLTKAALQEMALMGLDAVRNRAKNHKWDLTAVTTSTDAFAHGAPYRAVATENSLKIYSVGKNGKDDGGTTEDIVGFDFKESHTHAQ